MLQASQSNGKSRLFYRAYDAIKGTKYDLFTAAAFLFVEIQAIVIYSQIRHVVAEWRAPSGWCLSHSHLCMGSLRVCANNAQVDYYHYEVVLDASQKNHPWQTSVRAAMFTMAAMVRIPPLFGLCLSFVLCFYRRNRKAWQVTWLKKVAKRAVISYATFNFICVWGAWLRLVVFWKRQ
ncbi:hypothetical protein CSPX01_07145 [Colletotrichum filicis]|nr:hypothetical protein CSPX01_07145 [Colletotrichum filicis]